MSRNTSLRGGHRAVQQASAVQLWAQLSHRHREHGDRDVEATPAHVRRSCCDQAMIERTDIAALPRSATPGLIAPQRDCPAGNTLGGSRSRAPARQRPAYHSITSSASASSLSGTSRPSVLASGLEVDNKVELGRLHHWKIGGHKSGAASDWRNFYDPNRSE